MSHSIRSKPPLQNITRFSSRRDFIRSMSNVDFSLCPCAAVGCWGTSPPIEKCVLERSLDDYQMEFLEDKGLQFEGTARQNKVMAEIKKRIQVAEKHWPLLLRLKNAKSLPEFEKRFLGDILCTPGAERGAEPKSHKLTHKQKTTAASCLRVLEKVDLELHRKLTSALGPTDSRASSPVRNSMDPPKPLLSLSPKTQRPLLSQPPKTSHSPSHS